MSDGMFKQFSDMVLSEVRKDMNECTKKKQVGTSREIANSKNIGKSVKCLLAWADVPLVKRVIYSGNKTIVIWGDDTKTIVGCSEGETYDEFDGFTAALAKKLYGSTCAVKREIKKKSKHQ